MNDRIRKYLIEGTVMFISDKGDKDIGVTPKNLDEFMQNYISKHPNYLYYGIRYTGRYSDGVHLDFVIYTDDPLEGNKKGMLEKHFSKGLKHVLTKEYGSAYKGNDVTHCLKSTYMNLDLANKIYKEQS
ncbi:hypothetical protein COV24_00930 [candidate division WWE3 bacterium CG10_big_fil_rev_8_21_14_0_10_32_10]|uniref:Uncharacterized protein n=1 Tax=candidate division WWE3 bacterium CG10_big_fil_rev_8_21_14_0_10_32_10 TaxID=1975090 RepID=A0A2H0RB95_UNCKA|nr:MAG: hypothetical protein COV24_00930 [candidate division WWE3 bacterium CG10_big_fil_rev_8_21_14_0_10_32_10]